MKVGKFFKLPMLLLAVLFVVLGPFLAILINADSSPSSANAATEPTSAQIQAAAEEECGRGNDPRVVACRGSFKAGAEGTPSQSVKCDSYNTPQEKNRCNYAYPKGKEWAAAQGGGPNPSPSPSPGSAQSQDNQGCDGAFAWLICTMINGIGDVVKWVEGNIILPFLDVKPLQFTDSNNPMYASWKIMRDLANALFVVVFLIFIFAQTLSIQLDAYAIKKIIPKLVAAAILVQLSFLLCSLAIDIFNVLGRGMFLLIDGALPNEVSTPDGNHEEIGGILGIGALAGLVAGLASEALVAPLFTILIGAFFGSMAVFFTLMFRQILIVLLIVSAPLALVAWVLPSTEKLFKKWLDLFIKVLAMYPLVVLLFAAGKLFAVSAGAAGGALWPVFALTGLVAPLFLVPFAFKFVGGMIAQVGSLALKRGAGAGKAANGKLGGDLKQRIGTMQQNRAQGLGKFPKYLGGKRAATLAGRIATGQIAPGARTQSTIARNTQSQLEETSKLFQAGNLSWDTLTALSRGKASTLNADGSEKPLAGVDLEQYSQYRSLANTTIGKAAAAHALAKQKGVGNLPQFGQFIESAVRSGDMTATQADILWKPAANAEFGDFNKARPTYAQLGWDTSKHTPEAIQGVMNRLAGEKIADLSADGMNDFINAGARMSAAQISTAANDKSAEKMNAKQRETLTELIAKSIDPATSPRVAPAGAPPETVREANENLKRATEARIRYDYDAEGKSLDPMSRRADFSANDIRKAMQKNPSYKAAVEQAVAEGKSIPSPDEGGS